MRTHANKRKFCSDIESRFPWYEVKMVLCLRFFFRFLEDPGGSGGDAEPGGIAFPGEEPSSAAAAAAAEGGIIELWLLLLPPPPPPLLAVPVGSDLHSDRLYMYPTKKAFRCKFCQCSFGNLTLHQLSKSDKKLQAFIIMPTMISL